MARRKYTREELINLRSSPLVQKPDNLPAIEQWIDESQQQQQSAGGARRQAHAKVGGDASPMGAFSTGVRPGLVTRTTGTKGGDDISLGPPRTMFPSSRNVPKVTDAVDRSTAASGETNNGDEQDTARSRFGDRANRKGGNDKESKDTRESWTAARERRALAGDDESKYDSRYNRKDRDHDGDRRNGHGEKPDGRWGERRPNAWRERQREKERGFEKGGVAEKDPEWMDDPAPLGAEDDLRTMGMPRNQEQFQKWKEAMSGKKPQSEEIEHGEAESAIPTKEVTTAKTVATLKLEGIVDKPFGGWNDGKSTGVAADNAAKPVPAKGRASRFASMFKESQPKDEAPQVESTAPPAETGANGSAEDVAGFNRILQMLGGTSIAQSPMPEVPTSPIARTTSSGDKQKSRFTSFFDQTPKSPEGAQSPPAKGLGGSNGNNLQGNRGAMENPDNVFGGMLADNQSGEHARQGNMMSPQPPMNGNRDQSGLHNRMNDVFLDQQLQPPSRGTATPDVNIQNLLASQRAQKSQGQDKNSQFLLNLLQEKGTRPPSQQQRSDNFPLWLDQPPNMPSEPHAPKPRGAPPPPGFIDDQLLRNAPPDPPRQDQQPMGERRPSQRAPPGFFDDPSPFLQQQQQQQRRTFTEPPQQQHQQAGPARRLSGHPTNLPPMPLPPHQQFGGGPPPDFMQPPQALPGGGQGPPPGFNQQMPRLPPGFHNFPNAFQQPQRSDMPPGGGFPGGMPGGPPSNMASPPPNAPPGFYGAPPGMPPPPGFMGMRSPNDGIQAGGMGMRETGRGAFDGARFDGSGPRR